MDDDGVFFLKQSICFGRSPPLYCVWTPLNAMWPLPPHCLRPLTTLHWLDQGLNDQIFLLLPPFTTMLDIFKL
jgi:hypothetical protein